LPPKPCMYLSSTHMCYMPCPSQYDYNEQYLVRSIDHAAPHYSIFSIPLLPHPSHPKYPPQHPILKHIQPILVAPLSMSQTKFDTHLFVQAGYLIWYNALLIQMQ
jgi:hypothetical protein